MGRLAGLNGSGWFPLQCAWGYGQLRATAHTPPPAAPATPCPAAKCNCTGGARGSRVLQRTALPYFDRPCKICGAPAGNMPRCQVFTFTGRQKLSDSLTESANGAFDLCYSEFEDPAGKTFW